ncbi:MAG: GNAT family N-acetyltransferase [Oscillospiraceae bacterium]
MKLSGNIGIILLFEKEACGEIGYVLSKKCWNNGIMTEALTAVINFLFKKANFHRIQAHHKAPNIASGRVMLKSGMQLGGILRESTKTNKGTWCDAPISVINRIL